MDFEIPFPVGSVVIIRSTNVVGQITAINIQVCDTGHSISYEVAFPSPHGTPEGKSFFALELRRVDEEHNFGFGAK